MQNKAMKLISWGMMVLTLSLLCASVTLAQGPETPAQNVDPAANRAAYLRYVQSVLESGFMDEWRGGRPMKSMEQIADYLAAFSIWAFACQDAPRFNLNETENNLLTAFRKKAEAVQAEALPKLRDAFGPILRAQLKELEIGARTLGKSFIVAEFTGAPFGMEENILQFHEQVRMVLFQLRFKQADYKVTKDGTLLKSIAVSDFKDTDLIAWQDEDLNYNIVK